MSCLPFTRSRAALAAAGVFLLVPAVSLAAATTAYMTTTAMAAKIHGLVPQIPTNNTSAPSQITSTVCRGLGPAHNGRYATFRCKATLGNGTAVVWARALAGGRFCASATGLASCPAPPAVAGDPRICADPPTPPTADPNKCALGASELALIRAMKTNFGDPNWLIRNAACNGSNLTRKCTFSSHTAYGIYYTSTITFALADSVWTATIVTSGGGGTSTCTVQPDPSTAGGAPSVWVSGPTPTCTH